MSRQEYPQYDKNQMPEQGLIFSKHLNRAQTPISKVNVANATVSFNLHFCEVTFRGGTP